MKDEHTENPEVCGEYLCFAKWHGDGYIFVILEFDGHQWLVSESCEHIFWTCLPKKPA